MPSAIAEPAASPLQPPTPELLYLLCSDPADLAEAVGNWRGVDIAEGLNQMPAAAAAKVLVNLPFDLAVEILDEPELDRRHEIIQAMDRTTAAALVEALPADRQADFLRELPAAQRRTILSKISEPMRSSLETLMRFRKGTAGSLMTTEFVAVPSTATVEDAVQRARDAAHHRHTVHIIYVTEVRSGKLLRALSLQDLLLAQPGTPILDLGDQHVPLCARPRDLAEDVARIIAKYNLLALPIVDDDRRLIGVITVDDMIDSMVQEATQDVQRLGGVRTFEGEYLKLPFLEMIRKRAPWLAVLFIGEMFTATAMGFFEHEIARAVVLSLFIPLIISSGGNSGSQATSLIIRSLALRELRLRDWWRVAARELPTGIVLGSILGVLGFLRVLTWQQMGWYNYGPHHLLIAFTIGTALVGVVTFGSMAGSMLPFLLRRLGADPATASAPFVATLVDVTGLVIYFGLAFLILQGTML